MKFAKNDRGSAALEFAIVAPIWVTFVVGLMQIGMTFWVNNMMHNMVAATARCMAINVNNPSATQCFDQSSMRTYAQNYAQSTSSQVFDFSASASLLTLSEGGAGCAGGSQVSLSYTMPQNILFFFPTVITLDFSSCYPNWS
jgi:Flp pilus assembly protein TadG